MQPDDLKYLLEAALLASQDPLNIDALLKVAQGAPDGKDVSKPDLREALKALVEDYEPRGIELLEVASGFRIQVRQTMGTSLVALFEERPPRYSRAFFETLALIAYRQPITRGEIEDVRGVAVSSNIIRSMLEREWVRVVGHRDVPGKPAMFGTTKAFLDYFNLKKLDDLPSLAELTDIESLKIQLDLPTVEDGSNNPPAIAQLPSEAESTEEVDAPATEGDEAEAASADTSVESPDDIDATVTEDGDSADPTAESEEAAEASEEASDIADTQKAG
ncbi:MAG: SMC-Scp complex subunit ScpB [Pseudomonadota bacterium]